MISILGCISAAVIIIALYAKKKQKENKEVRAEYQEWLKEIRSKQQKRYVKKVNSNLYLSEEDKLWLISCASSPGSSKRLAERIQDSEIHFVNILRKRQGLPAEEARQVLQFAEDSGLLQETLDKLREAEADYEKISREKEERNCVNALAHLGIDCTLTTK